LIKDEGLVKRLIVLTAIIEKSGFLGAGIREGCRSVLSLSCPHPLQNVALARLHLAIRKKRGSRIQGAAGDLFGCFDWSSNRSAEFFFNCEVRGSPGYALVREGAAEAQNAPTSPAISRAARGGFTVNFEICRLIKGPI